MFVKGWKIAQKVVENCMYWTKAKAKRCEHIMIELLSERTEHSGQFINTTVDLFRPYQAKDVIKKRMSLRIRVLFSCIAQKSFTQRW